MVYLWILLYFRNTTTNYNALRRNEKILLFFFVFFPLEKRGYIMLLANICYETRVSIELEYTYFLGETKKKGSKMIVSERNL